MNDELFLDLEEAPAIDLLDATKQTMSPDEKWFRGIETTNAGDCLVRPKPREWIVDQVFARGSVSLIYGEPGMGKSWTLMDLGTAIASGEGEWLGFKTQQGNVLYLDLEMGKEEVEERQYMVNRGHGIDGEIPLTYKHFPDLNLHTERKRDLGRLVYLIRKHDAKIVLIDTMLDLADGADDNLAKDMNPLIKALKTACEETGTTIVASLHPNRTGNYRGSIAIKGKPDNLIKAELDGECIKMTFDKKRNGKYVTLNAMRWFSDGMFNLSSAGESEEPAEKKPKFNKGEEYVMRYIKEHGRSQKDVICNSADTCSSGTAKNAIYSLASRGLIKRVDDGTTTQKAEYDLA